MAELTSFVLPGGSPAAAALHLARTVCRRAERTCVALAEREDVSPAALKYLNRLSDLLFVAARFANDEGRGDVCSGRLARRADRRQGRFRRRQQEPPAARRADAAR